MTAPSRGKHFPMGSDGDLTWRTFRREIWWVVLLFPVTWAAIWVFKGEDLDSVLAAVGISVLMAVILPPRVGAVVPPQHQHAPQPQGRRPRRRLGRPRRWDHRTRVERHRLMTRR